jgi:pimeloyl-ACP methyl ester carboxylesterase
VADLIGLLDSLEVETVEVAAIDASVTTAFLLAMWYPERVTRLVLMEGTLPGLAGGFEMPPWWFGFHAVPELPETLIAGREDDYLGWFLRDVDDIELRKALVDAYRGRRRLSAGFGFYRAMDRNGELVRAALADKRPRVPTVALGGNAVGERLHRQREPDRRQPSRRDSRACGHIIPLARPDALASLLAG